MIRLLQIVLKFTLLEADLPSLCLLPSLPREARTLNGSEHTDLQKAEKS